MGGIGELFEHTNELQFPSQRTAMRQGFARSASMIALNLDPKDYFSISLLSPARKEAIDQLTADTMNFIVALEHASARMAILEQSAEKNKSKKP